MTFIVLKIISEAKEKETSTWLFLGQISLLVFLCHHSKAHMGITTLV